MSGVTTRTVTAAESDLRLDRWFKRHFPGLNHGRLEKLLRTGQVRVDTKRAKAGDRLAAGQQIRVPPLGPMPTAAESGRRPRQVLELTEHEARDLRRLVLHKDDDVLAIDKPAGLTVQGGQGITRHLDAMLEALQFEADERPRLVHRLDRDTSGVLLLGRNAKAAAKLAEAFRDRSTRKLYWAVVAGVPKQHQGRVTVALEKQLGWGGERVVASEGGKPAETLYRVVEHVGKRGAWLALMPLTGRTHQLRAHCAALGTPIVGDAKYGGEAAALTGEQLSRRLHLHARSIRLPHPAGGTLEVTAPLPADLRQTWDFFGFEVSGGDAPFDDFDE